MTLFQQLATNAGWDPTKGKGSSCTASDASGQCVLPWGSGTKSVNSIVLVATGVSFAVCVNHPCFLSFLIAAFLQVMALMFTTIGSAADYGRFGRWLLFVVTVICWASQFASMSLTSTFCFRAAKLPLSNCHL